ncbi:helix-turn-helix transcriptional regulator [Streptomyces sp. B1866]|uniref:helix-turn-helix domain-containing protein n=1 Tax=Streptomyces sp. B1866 TaxID=3075431 RepID=UPI00288EEDD2|nr:helix-turn-helix transcriptional regulator [Streptomyces sp. B1866]MDT3396877.1 helix-turn-helix transcriptional regulator [Streptomyces sp. B1866]
MSRSVEEHTGIRIADHRKLRHMTQRALAERAYVSYSSITKVETGDSPASPALVAAVARVLKVDPAVLYGQPYTDQMRQDQIDGMIRPLAEAVDLYELPPDEQVRPRPLPDLWADADALVRLARNADLRGVGSRVPGLLGELNIAMGSAPEGPDRRRTARALAFAHDEAHWFARRLGHTELAAIALERMARAAEQTQDPMMLALRLFNRSLTHVSRDNPGIAMKLVASAQGLVRQSDDPGSTAALAVAGKLHLRAAHISARAKNTDDATGYLNLAQENADRLGRERDPATIYWLSFGPADVAQYRLETNVELRHMSAALLAAKDVRFPAGHSSERVARYWMDSSRAYTDLGQNDAALKAMMKARGSAPQYVRYHPAAREVVGALVRRSKRLPESLSSLARWVGM